MSGTSNTEPHEAPHEQVFFTDISEHAGGKDRGGYSDVIGVSQRMTRGVQWATLRIAIAIAIAIAASVFACAAMLPKEKKCTL